MSQTEVSVHLKHEDITTVRRIRRLSAPDWIIIQLGNTELTIVGRPAQIDELQRQVGDEMLKVYP